MRDKSSKQKIFPIKGLKIRHIAKEIQQSQTNTQKKITKGKFTKINEKSKAKIGYDKNNKLGRSNQSDQQSSQYSESSSEYNWSDDEDKVRAKGTKNINKHEYLPSVTWQNEQIYEDDQQMPQQRDGLVGSIQNLKSLSSTNNYIKSSAKRDVSQGQETQTMTTVYKNNNLQKVVAKYGEGQDEEQKSNDEFILNRGKKQLNNELQGEFIDNNQGEPEDQEVRDHAQFVKSRNKLVSEFIHYLQEHPFQEINLVDLCDNLFRIPKRRIYDVVCALSGLGLVDKVAKNTVMWVGFANQAQLKARNNSMKRQVRDYERIQRELEAQLGKLWDKIENGHWTLAQWNAQIDHMSNRSSQKQHSTGNKHSTLKALRKSLYTYETASLDYLTSTDLLTLINNLPGRPKKIFLLQAQKGSQIQFAIDKSDKNLVKQKKSQLSQHQMEPESQQQSELIKRQDRLPTTNAHFRLILRMPQGQEGKIIEVEDVKNGQVKQEPRESSEPQEQ